MVKLNRKALKHKLEAYKRSPQSLVLYLLVVVATVLTIGILLYLIGYILITGIPHITPDLFAWQYTTANVSLMPALINTVLMTFIALLIAAPVGIFSAIYLVEYAKRGNKFVGLFG